MKLSTVITGNIILIVIISGLLGFFAENIRIYQPTVPANYNESFVKITNQLDAIRSNINETNDFLRVKSPTDISFFDYLSFFFKAGYDAMVINLRIILINNEIISMGTEAVIGNNENAGVVQGALLALVLLSMLAFIMSVIFKWDT